MSYLLGAMPAALTHDTLTVDEEREYAQKLAASPPGSRDWKVANDVLVTRNLKLVVRIINREAKALLPDASKRDELFQEGVLGLMDGIRRFDATRGFRLSTYVSWYVRLYAVTHALKHRDDVPASKRTMELHLVIRRKTAEFIKEHGRKPADDAELAAYAAMSQRVLRSLRKHLAQKSVSVDAPVAEQNHGGQMTLADVLAARPSNDASPLHRLEREEDRRKIASALGILDDRERFIILHCHGLADRRADPQTAEWCAEQLGITGRRARQLRNRALWRLRCHLTGKRTPRPRD